MQLLCCANEVCLHFEYRWKFLFDKNDLYWNQLTLKCTARPAWMHCKEKKQKHQLAIKCTTWRSKLLNFIFRIKCYVTFWWKMKITDPLGLILECQCTISSKYSWSNEEVFDAKRISYSEIGFSAVYILFPVLWDQCEYSEKSEINYWFRLIF